MSDVATGKQPFWKSRYTVISMCFAGTFVCYIDRVNISVAIIPMARDLGWDVSTQGAILSSFYIGYLLMQIGGGRLADKFGGKLVLGIGVLIWSVFTIFTPLAAFTGLYMLFAARIGMGLGEAVTFPSVYSMVTRWFPDDEKSKAIALNASGIPIGTVFALILTPIIVLHLGWEWAFYLFGAVGVLWYLLWQRLVTTDPRLHPSISKAELAHIQLHAPASGTVEQSPSLLTFLRNKPLWAIIVAHFCNNWTLYVVLSWLPKYVNEGLGISFAAVGLVSMLPHISSFVCLNIAGNIADRMIKTGMDVTFVRKLMQTIAFGGLATCLLLITLVDSVWAAIGILCLGKVFSAAGIGGHSVNHMDIGPQYAGTLMGITNTAGTIPGIVGVYISGLILHYTGSWDLVFQVTAGVTLFGMFFYLAFASGEKQFH
ncbi:MAG: ACS family MFS transporter [Pseudomonadota bacterium]|jgi:ACS family sodium-dependent inorganic phosphate cotransporter|nr:ACS family MFS transporter [Pseudomonadota bacterium]